MPGGFLRGLAKAGNLMKTAGDLLSPRDRRPKRPYRIAVVLDVEAHNKKEVDAAVKAALKKLESVGYAFVAKLIGIGGEVEVKDIGVHVEKEKKETNGEEDEIEEAEAVDPDQE